MRLPVWKRKSMLAQAIAQESPEQVQELTRRDVFVRLMGQYEPALRRLASGYAEQPADREDLFQEIAVGLWQAIPKFRGDASERTWLYRIAHNIAISSSTRRRRQTRKEKPIPELADYPSGAIDSEQAMLRREKQTVLLRAIRALPALDKQILLLHLEGMNYAQIEEISGLSQSAVGSRLSRLRESLRERIQSGGRGSDGCQG
jgi:RNA polymerase sigma factor (sigma-70 family)